MLAVGRTALWAFDAAGRRCGTAPRDGAAASGRVEPRLNEHYLQIFSLTRLDEAIRIHDTEAAAIAAAG